MLHLALIGQRNDVYMSLKSTKFGQNRCFLVVFALLGRQYISIKEKFGTEEYMIG